MVVNSIIIDMRRYMGKAGCLSQSIIPDNTYENIWK
jgi:hypothetical protein